jgi:hypothetical protein
MQGIESLKNKGRFGDTELAHLTPGEVVLPADFLGKYPSLKTAVQKALKKEDTLLNELIVGNELNSINPQTGLPEFFLKKFKKKIGKFFKKVRRVLDPVAEIAKFVPGPWQAPANIYSKARAAGRIVTGEGGIGDAISLFTGPKVFGESGSLSQLGGGTGSVGDTFSSIKEYVLPGEDKRGIFKNLGRDLFGMGQQQQVAQQEETSEFNYAVTEQQREKAQNYLNNLSPDDLKRIQEFQPDLYKQLMYESGQIQPLQSLVPTVMDKDGRPVPVNQLRSSGIFQTPSGRKFDILDDLFGIDPKGGGIFGSLGNVREGIKGVTGIDPTLALLAKRYGELTEKALRERQGGMQDVRAGIRKDLAPVQTFGQGGFDLGLGGGFNNPKPQVNAFAKGGAVVGESDYAEGGSAKKKSFELLISPEGLILDESNAAIRQQSIFGKVMRSLEDIPDRDFDAYVEAVRKGQVKDDLSDRAVYVETGKPVNEPDPNAPFKMPLRTAYDNHPEIFELAVKYVKNTKKVGKAKGGIMDTDEALEYAEGGDVLDMRSGGESIGPGTGTSDDIPAMLSDGEFVMTAKANLGAGSMQMKKKKGGIMELSPALEPDRQRGAKNMMKLMKYFEGVA